jgi:hypothetical protein
LAVLLPIQNEPIVEIEIVFAADIPVTVIEPVTAKLEWLAEEHVIPLLAKVAAPAALPIVKPALPIVMLVELELPKLIAAADAFSQALLIVLPPIQSVPADVIETKLVAVIEPTDKPVTLIDPVTAMFEWLAEEHVIPLLCMAKAPAALPMVWPL